MQEARMKPYSLITLDPVYDSSKVDQLHTHCRDEQFPDFFNGSPQFDLRSILCILDGDEDVKFFVQMFPVRLPSILLLLNISKQFRYFERTWKNIIYSYKK